MVDSLLPAQQRALSRHRVVACISAWAIAIAVLSIATFAAVRWEAVMAARFDWPILLKLNHYVSPSDFVNHAISGISNLPLLTGILLVSLWWYLWLSLTSETAKAKLLLGLAAASVAVTITRGMQLTLPTHLRPLYNPELGFHGAPGLDFQLSRWNSFPSDHACLYFALVAVIWLQSRELGIFALLPALVGNLPRIYFGIHYPTDVIFGALFGIFFVILSENYGPETLARHAIEFERKKTNVFYSCAFVLTYLVGTLFEDVRDLATSLAKLLRLIIS
jgi:undecaprenyl-diphosphatase